MALPTILFNSSGSDTVASGAGPATALTGAGASLNSTTAVNLSANTPDLSGVATDGSACLFVNTSSGQKYAKITAVDNGTDIVTVATAYSVTESGKTWAIGGKRATLEHATSRILLTTTTGALAGWAIEIETDQTITTTSIVGATSGDTTSGPIIIRGSSGSVKTILQTANTSHFSSTGGSNPTNWRFENLKFSNSNATKTAAFALNFQGGVWFVDRSIFGDVTNTLGKGINRTGAEPFYHLTDCDFAYSTIAGIEAATSATFSIYACRFFTNAVGLLSSITAGSLSIYDCLFYGNTGDGFRSSANGIIDIKNCTFHDNDGDGIDISGAVHSQFLALNNNITANGAYGITAASGQANFQSMINHNNFGAGGLVNTSGAYSNLTAGANDLAVDPGYVDAAGGNFEVGTAVKALGFVLSSRTIGANQSATNPFIDIGAAQREEPASGGGGARYVSLNSFGIG